MFDLSKPHVQAIPSPMGGGWVLPLTAEGESFLREWFDDEPVALAPLGDVPGFIVEPSQSADLAEALREAGLAWAVGEA